MIQIKKCPRLKDATLVLAFSGWMDGGDVSTGTVERLVHLLSAKPFAEIDSEPFYIYNFPGSMEVTAMFRPHIDIENGLVNAFDDSEAVTYYAFCFGFAGTPGRLVGRYLVHQ